MLDVLELDALGPPHEDGVRVRAVDDVGDLETELPGLGEVLVGRIDAQAEMVEQRALRLLPGAAVDEPDLRRSGRDALSVDPKAELAQPFPGGDGSRTERTTWSMS